MKAIECGIQRLYHYEKFNPDYLATTLSRQSIRCSDLRNLNDPWDCKPWFDANTVDDPAKRASLIAWLDGLPPAVPMLQHQEAQRSFMLHNDLEFLRQVVVGMSENFKETSKRWRIYCLTPLPDSTLMWSHYAENHRGICLEFAVDNEIFGNAREVAYRSEYPCWLPHDPPDEGMIEVLLTKSDDWKYEKEFRIVARASTVNAELPTLPGEHYLALPAGALRSVIIGCQGDFEAISILVAKKAPGLPVRRAVRTPNHYRLKIEPA